MSSNNKHNDTHKLLLVVTTIFVVIPSFDKAKCCGYCRY